MIKGGAIEKGMYILFKGDPYLVAEREFVNPGKGAAFTRCKLKNAKNGSVLKETIKTSDNVEEANVFDRDAQYLYVDEAYHFMDVETYDQFEISAALLSEKGGYLMEGEQYRIIMWEAEPIDVIIPMKIVVECDRRPRRGQGRHRHRCYQDRRCGDRHLRAGTDLHQVRRQDPRQHRDRGVRRAGQRVGRPVGPARPAQPRRGNGADTRPGGVRRGRRVVPLLVEGE
jgi:elongation factor P